MMQYFKNHTKYDSYQYKNLVIIFHGSCALSVGDLIFITFTASNNAGASLKVFLYLMMVEQPDGRARPFIEGFSRYCIWCIIAE